MSGSIRIIDMPDLGSVTDTSSIVGERSGSGRFSARAFKGYVSPEVYVRDFGAVGDGVTDDTAALQAAVNTVVGPHGGRVHIGNLRLRINGTVNIPAFTRLGGDFRHGGLNASQDWYQYGSQICLGTTGNITVGGGCEIEHILFIRAGLYTALPASLADALAIVANFSGTGLDISNSPDYLVSQCMFLGFTTGINAPNTSRANIIDCLFDCTNGVYCSLSSDISRYERNHFWPLMTMLVPGVGVAPGPLRRAGYAMKMQSNTWDHLINCFNFGYDGGFWVDTCSNNTFVACSSDYPNSATSLGGFRFTGVAGYCKMISCLSMVPVVINNSIGGLDPIVEIIGGTFVNGGINVTAGGALIHGAVFENCNPAINYGSGTLVGAVVGCHFDRCGQTVSFANASVQALVSVVGNVGMNGSPTTNEQLLGALTVPGVTVKSPGADLILNCTGAGTDQKIWDLFPDNGGSLNFRLANDAFTAANTWMRVDRSGDAAQNLILSTAASIALSSPNITLSGNLSLSGTVSQIIVSSASPAIAIRNTSVGADLKLSDQFVDSSGTLEFRLLNDAGTAAGAWLNVTRTGYSPTGVIVQAPFRMNSTVGFNGNAPVAKPTVTGAKGGNAALLSLILALRDYGLINDGTS